MLEFVLFLILIIFSIVALVLACYIISHYKKDFLLSKLIELNLKSSKLSFNSKRYNNIRKQISDLEYKLNLYDYYLEAKNEKKDN